MRLTKPPPLVPDTRVGSGQELTAEEETSPSWRGNACTHKDSVWSLDIDGLWFVLNGGLMPTTTPKIGVPT